jgi:hypothetical protein
MADLRRGGEAATAEVGGDVAFVGGPVDDDVSRRGRLLSGLEGSEDCLRFRLGDAGSSCRSDSVGEVGAP